MQVKFLNAAARAKTIALDWPVEVDGKEYREIIIKRLTAAEVAAFMEALKARPPEAEVRWPIYVDEEGAPLPEGLLDALDVDDQEAVMREGLDFLPRRFRDVAAGDSAPPAGASTV